MWNKKLNLVWILVFLLTSGFLFISLISYFTAHDSIKSQIEKTTLPLTSDTIYSEIQRDLLPAIFISSMMAKDTFVRDWVLSGEKNTDSIVKYLNEVQDQYQTVTSFFVSEQTHRYYHSSGVLKSVSEKDQQDIWYFRVKDMATDYEINVDNDTADRLSFSIFVNHRVYDYSGNYLGAIGVGLAVTAVQKLMQNYKERFDREVYFIDKTGKIMLHTDTGDNKSNIKDIEGLSTHISEILNNENSSVEYEAAGGAITYLNSRFVKEFGWYLVVAEHATEEEQRIQHDLIINLLVSFIVSLIIILLVTVIINNYQKKLEKMATTDKLTGCANRQIFGMFFKQAHSQTKRAKSSLSVIMFDIDHFKQVNDVHGHISGDLVLKTLINKITDNIRESDLIFRWGGEEFVIILPETDINTAYVIADKIRTISSQLEIELAQTTISVTISLGVALMSDTDTRDTLLEKVDKALYKAKEKGRNRTEFL